MSITDILEQVRVNKPCSIPHLRRYLRKLKIQPLGCNQKPLNWPDDSGKRILAHLGFARVFPITAADRKINREINREIDREIKTNIERTGSLSGQKPEPARTKVRGEKWKPVTGKAVTK